MKQDSFKNSIFINMNVPLLENFDPSKVEENWYISVQTTKHINYKNTHHMLEDKIVTATLLHFSYFSSLLPSIKFFIIFNINYCTILNG